MKIFHIVENVKFHLDAYGILIFRMAGFSGHMIFSILKKQGTVRFHAFASETDTFSDLFTALLMPVFIADIVS